MNQKSSKNKYKILNNKSSPEYQVKNINYKNIVPSLSYQNQNQGDEKNIQYFPIESKESFTRQHIIYLAAGESNNLNDYAINNEYNLIKNNIKNKKIYYYYHKEALIFI